MTNIDINSQTCIKCRRCARICPSKILIQNGKGTPIEVVHPENCILCGHCVGVCPTEAVTHSEFPTEKIHLLDYNSYPTAGQMMSLCKGRRSNRAFSRHSIPEEKLEQILEAAHRAPTASNLQQVAFTLITDPEKLRSISEFTLQTFGSVRKKLTNPFLKPLIKLTMPDAFRYIPVFDRLQQEYKAGNDMILRKATAVILIHTPKANRFGCMDANLAYQNGSLMAECLGVSQFYTGFVCSAIQQNGKGSLEKSLGIDGVIQAGMALGMPEFRFKNYIDKKDISVRKL